MANVWLAYALSLIIAFFNSVVLNSLFVEREGSSRSSHLPSAVFLIFSGIASQIEFMLHNQLLVLFVLVALFFVQRLEQSINEVNDSFFAGFFIALASTLTPFAIVLFVLVIFRAVSTRWSVSRVFFLITLGFLIPLYLSWTLNFLFNNGAGFIESYFSLFTIEFIGLSQKLSDKISLIFLIVIGIISVISTINSEAYKNVNPRAWIQLWMIFSVFFLIIGLFVSKQNGSFQLAITPIAGFLCFTILGAKRKLLRKSVFYLVFVAMLIDHANTIGLINL